MDRPLSSIRYRDLLHGPLVLRLRPVPLYGAPTSDDVNANANANLNANGEGKIGEGLEDSFVQQYFEENLFDSAIFDGQINTIDGVHTNEIVLDTKVKPVGSGLGNRVLGPKNVLIYDTTLRGMKGTHDPCFATLQTLPYSITNYMYNYVLVLVYLPQLIHPLHSFSSFFLFTNSQMERKVNPYLYPATIKLRLHPNYPLSTWTTLRQDGPGQIPWTLSFSLVPGQNYRQRSKPS